MEFRPEHFITYVSGKYPRLWALKGVNPNDVRRWYKFGALASIYTVAPSFREISKLLDWVLNAVVESWHNNPHFREVVNWKSSSSQWQVRIQPMRSSIQVSTL
ncbi:hypothetical protein ACS0TY_002345 [Phlomoides rotata]